MSNRLWNASKRLTLVGLAAAAVTALAGCVVAPAYPARHGYGYYDGAPPVVVRTPPPPPRYYPYYRYRGW